MKQEICKSGNRKSRHPEITVTKRGERWLTLESITPELLVLACDSTETVVAGASLVPVVAVTYFKIPRFSSWNIVGSQNVYLISKTTNLSNQCDDYFWGKGCEEFSLLQGWNQQEIGESLQHGDHRGKHLLHMGAMIELDRTCNELIGDMNAADVPAITVVLS